VLKLLFLISFLITVQLISQEPASLHSVKTDNLNNLPFTFGIDAGSSLRLKEKENHSKLGFSAFMNINIYKKAILLRIEVGNFDQRVYLYEGTNETYYSSVWCLSLGLQYNIFRFGRNRVNIGGNLQLLAYGKNTNSWLTIFGNTELAVPLTDFLAATGGVKLHYGRSWNPFLTLGFQIGNFR
jgi:hypothetical protein